MSGSIESIRNDSRKKIAIVGKAPSSLSLAPYADESWQIWTLSDLVLCKQAARFDVHFELHQLEQLSNRKPYVDWLASIKDKPVLLCEAADAIPRGIVYPKDEILAKYGGYFTNTVSWMIALAIDTAPDQIGVWGVDMACNDEYGSQRPSCEYFLGLAAGKGIGVYTPPQCDLLKCAGLYGFETKASDLFVKWRTRTNELIQRHKEKCEARDNADRNVAYLSGAIEYCLDEAKKDDLQKNLKNAQECLNNTASEALYLQGALEDCRDYWGQWAQQL